MNRNVHLAAVRPNGIAPSPGGFKLGGKSGTLARAWQFAWDRLSSQDFMEANSLAREAALKYALKPVSIMTLIHRMVAEGVLEGESRKVRVTSERTHKMRDADTGGLVKQVRPYIANVPKLHVRIVTHD